MSNKLVVKVRCLTTEKNLTVAKKGGNMKIKREAKKINGEGVIVLCNDTLKEPNFELLKEMLHLGDDVEEVRISFKQYDVRRKIK